MTIKRQLNNLIKQWYEFYAKNINSQDFKKFIEDHSAQRFVTEDNYLNELIDNDRTDLYDKYEVSKITICDVLDNKGVNKLIGKIYNLPDDLFKHKCRYVKPTLFKKYDFVHLRYNYTEHGILAEIELLKDKHLDRIDIMYSQVNNYYCFVEYVFYFKSKMDEDSLDKFIATNISLLTCKDYRPFYKLDKSDKNFNYFNLIKFHNDMLPIVCQHYITSFLYSDQGGQSKLPSLCYCTREEPINIETLVYSRFGATYYNKKENYIIDEDIDNVDFVLCAGNNYVPNLQLSKLIAEFGNEFYFIFLGKSFIKNYEYDFSKYISRKSVSHKVLSTLLKYYYGLIDHHIGHKNIVEKFNETWEMYYGYEKVEFDVNLDNYLDNYKTIFKNSYEHLKALSDSQSSKIGKIISYSALGISILSFILSIIFHFC